MEELAGQLDNQDNNFLCLICGCCAGGAHQSLPSSKNDHGISKQLNVIFILRNLLQVPNSQLHKFLKNYGNPDSWISLCDQCTQLTREARELHLQIVKITRQLKGYQKLIVEKVKLTTGDTDDDNGRSKANKLMDKDNPKLIIWKTSRKFVKTHNYDDLCPDDPIFEANKLIKKLEAPEPPPPSPQLKVEHEDIFEDLSPGTPDSPDWTPLSPEDSKVTQDNPLLSKPKRIRNRQPPLPPSEYTNQCPHCPLKFRFYSQVFSHMHSTHSISDYPCLHPNCSSILKTIKKYSKHRVKKHLNPPKPPKTKIPKEKSKKDKISEPRVICDICGADLASKNNLNQHIKFVHEKSKKFKRFDVSCHICGLVVKNVNLRIHLLRLHKDEVEVPARKVKGQEGRVPASLHKCPVVGCKIEYLRKEGLDKHMIRAHGGEGEGGGEGQGEIFRYSCVFCGKGFSLRRKLAHHEMVHRNNHLNLRPFKCELCGKGFSTKKYLNYHRYHTHKLAKKFREQVN